MSAGCADINLIPASGPNAITMKRNATWNGPPYGLVKLTPQVISVLEEYSPRTLSAVFGDRRPPPEIRFGLGDVVSVSIFEAAAGGLFIPSEAGVRPGNFVTLPNQPIDTKGMISVPYAGLVPTAGKTPAEVEQEIVARIKNRAIEPQAVVALVNQNSSLITVIRRSKYYDYKPHWPYPGATVWRANTGRDHAAFWLCMPPRTNLNSSLAGRGLKVGAKCHVFDPRQRLSGKSFKSFPSGHAAVFTAVIFGTMDLVSEVTRPMVSVRYLCGYRACGNEYPFSQRRHCRQICRCFDWIFQRCCLACE